MWQTAAARKAAEREAEAAAAREAAIAAGMKEPPPPEEEVRPPQQQPATRWPTVPNPREHLPNTGRGSPSLRCPTAAASALPY
eukprot:4721170-Prymnesium_polylepis.1